MAGRALFGGWLQRLMHSQLVLYGLDRALAAAPDEPGCWEAIRRTLIEAGFAGLQVRLNGREFRQPGPAGDRPCWQLCIPLPGGDYVKVERSYDSPVQTLFVGPLVDLLHRSLPGRLTALASTPSTDAMALARLAACVDSFEPAVAPRAESSPPRQRPHPVS